MVSQLSNKDWVWWKHGIIYHIYPLSFKDSDNDGFGDLQGIIDSLDYLVNLGIDAIWLSPIFQSPFNDFGYDISDFCSIDPRFGTMDDFRELLEKAHKAGLKVVLDLVMNHTSDQHPWFMESSSSPDNPKSNWYIWHTGTGNSRPNNWKSATGGAAWTFHPQRRQYYYHSFFNNQPDLNWRNKELKQTFFDQVSFWLDMGVDGFRLDVINLVVKDKKFRNAPFLALLKGRNSKSYTRNRPKSYKIVAQLRKLINNYENRLLIGEIYTPPPGDASLVASYLGSKKQLLHLAFDFSIMFRRWSAVQYFKCIDRWIQSIPQDGWPCYVMSNHDLSRYINRFGFGWNRDKKAKIIATLLLTLKGTPVLYYGDEIGMRNTRIHRKNLMDPLGKRYWPFYSGRDKSRTPMQWNSLDFAGFSEVKPWLPVNNDYPSRNIQDQLADDNSLLNFYMKLLKIRKNNKGLQFGEWIPAINGNKSIMAYYRKTEEEVFLITLNFSRFQKK
ncbi:MAG: alpha-glucosidase [Bacteroidales bacterium]|nr:alpha-glucosidase [Bacteroidales bacterium]